MQAHLSNTNNNNTEEAQVISEQPVSLLLFHPFHAIPSH